MLSLCPTECALFSRRYDPDRKIWICVECGQTHAVVPR